MTIFYALYKYFLFFSLGYGHLPATEASGIVTDKNTGQPLSQVYVYSIKGEEETLSNEKGVFKIISWEALPVTVSFEKKGYRPFRLPLQKEQKNIKVILEAY
ncbi:MAG: hypothetical protein EOP53_25875 [Sphingobacteriales bacterium]|nr:MAG: hypothetical protein EOP53_25875 [Sphingobacteriales bacterium]